ncbi:MAG: substrate-binding domain-containing protein [Deltaproteobacteria bacterium]|jgi:molybdate transport system substrate-binding protein|nr:substrate-binding domain-containing protein [Deltaproteobacteria bacterium]
MPHSHSAKTPKTIAFPRRDFLKKAVPAAMGAAVATTLPNAASPEAQAAAGLSTLQVWSCGGLAEAMMPANDAFGQKFGARVLYTGAFAAALGKSLLANGRTEVFAGRVLDLAKNLRKAGRMKRFVPLCYTTYVIVTPKGNPAGIKTLQDMGAPGIRVAMAQHASPPGGAAVVGLLKKAGLLEAVMPNLVENGTCVQRSVELVCKGKADAMIVELRIPRMPSFAPSLDIIEIPAEVFPPGPLTFTVGVMDEGQANPLSEKYLQWIVSPDGGGPFFEQAGFITPYSALGQEMTKKFGVYDV